MAVPKLSIITPCYNAGAYIGELIESVRTQTLRDWQHIIVDDGSTDNSADVISEYAKIDSRLQLISQPNSGVSRARRHGLDASSPSSMYLYFLDADDVLEPNMLEVMVGYLDKHPNVGLAYCDYTYIDAEGNEIGTDYVPRYAPSRFGVKQLPPSTANTPFVSVYCWAPVMESVSVLRRSIYEQTPGWDERIGQPGEGVDLFLHFALLSDVHFVAHKLYRYRRHSSQASADIAHIFRQSQKVEAKWRSMTSLTSEQQRIVRAARRFRGGRLRTYQGLKAASEHFRKGSHRVAVKVCLRTLWNHVAYQLKND